MGKQADPVGGVHDHYERGLERDRLAMLDLVSVEGIAFALPDLDGRLGDETDRGVVLEAARAIERVPELLGIGPHLIATARRADH